MVDELNEELIEVSDEMSILAVCCSGGGIIFIYGKLQNYVYIHHPELPHKISQNIIKLYNPGVSDALYTENRGAAKKIPYHLQASRHGRDASVVIAEGKVSMQVSIIY